MFDKITKNFVESVHLPDSKKTRRISAYILPGLALLVSLSSLAISYLAYAASQEGMNIFVRRNIANRIDVAQPDSVIVPNVERADFVYVSTWDVSIINTSITSTIPVTGYEIGSQSFSGYQSIQVAGEIGPRTRTHLTDEAGRDVQLPFVLKPGEISRFVLTTNTPVSAKAFKNAPSAIPPPENGHIEIPMGDDGLDPFGNTGEFMPDGWTSPKNAEAKEPCVRVSFDTGRGHSFTGVGYWYEKVFREAGERLSTIAKHPVCLQRFKLG
jgi:hypothetical protein